MPELPEGEGYSLTANVTIQDNGTGKLEFDEFKQTLVTTKKCHVSEKPQLRVFACCLNHTVTCDWQGMSGYRYPVKFRYLVVSGMIFTG